ncbi:MAG: hypothetical protein WC315_00845 [Candidatus Omnitrophota bacterium]|jgi:RAB protein geranylgeranyltransferase component A
MRKLRQAIVKVLADLKSVEYTDKVIGPLAHCVAYLEGLADPTTEQERESLVVGLRDCVNQFDDFAEIEEDNGNTNSAEVLHLARWDALMAIYFFDR